MNDVLQLVETQCCTRQHWWLCQATAACRNVLHTCTNWGR